MSTVRLRLDFAPRASRTSPPRLAMLLTGLLLFIVAIVLLGLTLTENARQSRQLAIIEANVKRVAPARQLRLSPAQLARVQFVSQTSRSLSTPWADLLAALEATPANVALLAVEPSAAKRNISITAEAASTEDMLAYLQALQKDNRLSDALLTSHQMQTQAPGTPVRFQIQASWGEAR